MIQILWLFAWRASESTSDASHERTSHDFNVRCMARTDYRCFSCVETDDYSARSATTGSTRKALRTGTMDAAHSTAMNATATIAYVSGSPGDTSNNRLRIARLTR